MNTRTCILTIGISSSGKSAWAESFIEEKDKEGEWWIDLNRDEIRKEVFIDKNGAEKVFSWNEWNRKWEKEVTAIWKRRINELYLLSKENDPSLECLNGVIISDTNLNYKTRYWLREIFEKAGYDVLLKFFPISYQEAVKRDRGRLYSVGHSVIMEQWVKYQEQFGEKYIPNENKSKAVIVDIDGTLAIKGDRDIYDWDKVQVDLLNNEMADIISGLKLNHYKIIILSGRQGRCKKETIEWLNRFGIYPDLVLMRTDGDMRSDYIIKKELFDYYIRDDYNVRMVFDDRPQVLRLWISLGIKTFAIGNPWIEF